MASNRAIHMSPQTSLLYGFTEVIKFIVYLLCNNCLYAVYSQLTLRIWLYNMYANMYVTGLMYHQGYILQAQMGFHCLLLHKGSMLLVLSLTCKDLTGISMWLYDLYQNLWVK